MRSAMRPEYGVTPGLAKRPRSRFNLSESLKTTFDANYLIPVYWDYLYPGEVRKATTRAYVRLSNPLQFPIMDNIYITFHWFDVSLRILWTNFRKFYGEQENPGDSIDYTIPRLGAGAINMQSGGVSRELFDYMGVPNVTSFELGDASALPFRAYNKIWNYYYRDQLIQNSVTESTDDGPDTNPAALTEYQLLTRGKRFDYFTNVTPAPQRGDSVMIGGEVESSLVVGNQPGIALAGGTFNQLDSDSTRVDISATASSQANSLYPNTTINELRNAVAIQQFLERDNRHGTRFGEMIWSHWGAEFNDARYAPVYIAGGRAPIMVTPIMNAAANTTESADLGDLGGIGSGAFEGASFTYAATEPSILMCIANVHADQTYHQGISRKHSYTTRYDFMWPEFQGIGDQALLNKEIYYQNSSADDDVFGYSPRYEECRTGYNRLTAEFRPDHPLSLDVWHVAQDFGALPTLNDTFIKSSVPMGRVLQSTTNDHCIADIHFSMYSTKELSLTGVPGLARL